MSPLLFQKWERLWGALRGSAEYPGPDPAQGGPACRNSDLWSDSRKPRDGYHLRQEGALGSRNMESSGRDQK